jgi:hypothetical protein
MRRLIFAVLAILTLTWFALGAPGGPQFTYNNTESPTPAGATSITTAGGSFTTLVMNGTTQTLRWKAYVGNVTGSFTLDDASGFTIYDWQLATVTGEVYASRNSSITFSNVICANRSIIASEDTSLNGGSSREDSINRTFVNSTHRTFLVGTTNMTTNSCPSIATYVNDSSQAVSAQASFQEVLLSDSNALVYTTLLENKTLGYNRGKYDFQLIVAESEVSGPSTYYFWVELG